MQRTLITTLLTSLLLMIIRCPAHAEPIVVVAISGPFFDQVIFSFDNSDPATITQPKRITGLGLETVFNIDFRPSTGELYGLTQFYNVYKMNPVTGAATLVPTQLGSLIPVGWTGIDFSPVTDLLRIVTSAGQNFRLNVDTGAAVHEPSHQFAPGDPTMTFSPQVTTIAYTNNFVGATSTVLYGIETNQRILVIQDPEEQALLHTVGPLLVNPLNGTFVGFDISGSTGIGYATFNTVGRPDPNIFNHFYTIDLNTGRATLIGTIGGGSFSVHDIAVAPGIQPDICLQDDSTGNILQINSTTGQYQFTNCSGVSFGGIGTVTRRGGIITLQQSTGARRVLARIDLGVNRGTASIELLSQGSIFTITDRNVANNSCTCQQ